MSMPGTMELMVILAIILIVFGAGKLPDVMKQFGKGIKEFKDASTGEGDVKKRIAEEEEPVKSSPRQIAGGDELDDDVADALPGKKRTS